MTSELGSEREAAARQQRQLDRLRRDLRAVMRRGASMEADARHRLRRILEDHVDGLWAEVLDSSGPERAALVDRLNVWWEDEDLEVAIELWGKRFEEDVRRWGLESEEALQRRLDTPSFKLAFPDLAAAGLGFLRPAATRRARQSAGAAAKSTGALADKEVVLELFHRFGHKFKPWGATKAAARFAKVGAVLGVVSVTWDAVTFVKAELADRGSAVRLEAAQDQLRSGVEEALRGLADGDASEPGPGANVLDGLRQLDEEADELATRARALRYERQALSERIERIEGVALQAWTALSDKET